MNSEFARFVDRRSRLNGQLDEARARIDAWIEQHPDEEGLSASDLALLEGFLASRQDLLKQLLDLDESFMQHLLNMRAPARE